MTSRSSYIMTLCSSYLNLFNLYVANFEYISSYRFLEYCSANDACVEVDRKDKVEDIADTLKRLNLLSAASSGKQ